MRAWFALFRLSLAAVVAGLMLIPGMFVFHFAGAWGAVAAWIVTYAWLAWSMIRYLRQREQTLWEALTTGRPDASDQQFYVFLLVGLAFLGGGIAMLASDPSPSKKSKTVVTLAEHLSFSSIFIVSGSGMLGMGLAGALIRRQMRIDLAEIDERIAMRPDSADLRRQRAALLRDHGKTAEAIDALGEAIRLAPEQADLYFQRGEACYFEDRNEEAIADLTRAIELAPANAEAYVLRSLVYEETGQAELAKADEERAMELEPESDEGSSHQG